MGKRRKVDDPYCMFCTEKEIVHHLLFDCVVSRKTWEMISGVLGVKMGNDYESVAKLWPSNKHFGVANILSSALCWSVWKLRNSLCFQETPWTSLRNMWQRMVPLLLCWKVLVPLKLAPEFKNVCSTLERMAWSVEKQSVLRLIVLQMTLRRGVWLYSFNRHDLCNRVVVFVV
jgi:hypothetical protein